MPLGSGVADTSSLFHGAHHVFAHSQPRNRRDVQGTATDASGFVGNTTVTLYAWPALDNLNVGDTTQRDVVGTATTNATGGYSISITNWGAIALDVDSHNVVNLELLAFTHPR